jgi:hypothetical protein
VPPPASAFTAPAATAANPTRTKSIPLSMMLRISFDHQVSEHGKYSIIRSYISVNEPEIYPEDYVMILVVGGWTV